MARYRRWVTKKWLAATCALASTLALTAALGGMVDWQHQNGSRALAQSSPDLSANLPPVTVGDLNRFRARIGGASVAVSVVELDASQPDFQMRPFWSSPYQIPGLMDTQAAARREGADIVINGGFFSRITHQPLGAIKVDNSWISGPILGRGVMAWTDSGDFLFDRVQFYEEAQLSNGETLLISDLNSGYFRPGFSRYTPVWGRSYTTETDNEVAIVVENNRIVDIRIADAAGSLTLSIPSNGYLLVARQTDAVAQARSLPLGADVIVSTRTTPDLLSLYPHAIGAGPLLMKDGAIVLDAELERFRPPFPTQRAARSAVGLTADRKLLFVTAGKGEEDTGITLGEMAVLMQQLGSQQALNLDGGTSSTLYVGDRVVNFNGRPPRVHNYLGIFQN
ncbi:MAG: phosphodiester glycosidase family protein [Cyanobacteria bacterium J06597_1]